MAKVVIDPIREEVIRKYCEFFDQPHSIEKFIGLTDLLTHHTWLPVTSEVLISVLVSRRLITKEVLIGRITERVEGLNRRL